MQKFEHFVSILATEGGNILILFLLTLVGGIAVIFWHANENMLLVPALSTLFKTMSSNGKVTVVGKLNDLDSPADK